MCIQSTLGNTRNNLPCMTIAWFQPCYYESDISLIELVNLNLNKYKAVALCQYLFRYQNVKLLPPLGSIFY